MNNAFYIILKKFSDMIELETEFADISTILITAIVVIAIGLCFFGRLSFRVFAGFMSFFIFALLSMLIMKNANPGEKATVFAILGIIVVAITIRWYAMSAFLMAGMIGYSIMALFSNILWLNIVVAVLIGTTANLWPAYGMIFITALWGGFMTAYEGNTLLELDLKIYIILIIGFVLFLLGLVVQYFTNKKLLNMNLKERRRKVFR